MPTTNPVNGLRALQDVERFATHFRDLGRMARIGTEESVEVAVRLRDATTSGMDALAAVANSGRQLPQEVLSNQAWASSNAGVLMGMTGAMRHSGNRVELSAEHMHMLDNIVGDARRGADAIRPFA